jgi:hypothetical protein
MKNGLKNNNREVKIEQYHRISSHFNEKVIDHDRRGKPHQWEVNFLRLKDFDIAR